MKIEVLKKDRVEDFLDYCRKHKNEVDGTFLHEEDLQKFASDEENPTYIITDEAGVIRGTASLVIGEYNRRGKRARFRIFHSEIEDIDLYKKLLQAILNHTTGLDKIFIFIPLQNKELTESIVGLDFNVERYSFLLVREDMEISQFTLPEGYEIRDFQPNSDEEIYCTVRNAGFANLKGNETPITINNAKAMSTSQDYLEGGIKILYHGDRPVGVVRGTDDDFEDAPMMCIGPLAILPEYQGKGLGRILLRTALAFAKEKGYNQTILCVNAENDRAKSLYIQEGFQQVEAVACYKYDL